MNTQQIIPARAVIGKTSDPNARADFGKVALNQKWLGQAIDYPSRERFGPATVGEQNDKLVAAQPHEKVLVAGFPAQPLRDQAQQRIAHGMTQGLVDGSELVEIDHQHSRLRCTIDHAAQDFVAMPAVAQSGQSVGDGLLGHRVSGGAGTRGRVRLPFCRDVPFRAANPRGSGA